MSINSMFFLISICVGAIVFMIAMQVSGGKVGIFKTRAGKAIAESQKPAKRDDVPEEVVDPRDLKGLAKTLAEAGLRFTPLRFTLFAIALGALGTVAGWLFFIPGLPSLFLGGALVYFPFAYIKDRALTRGQRMDKELPITLARISVGLQTGKPMTTIFTDAAKHLPPDNPLAAELFRCAQDMGTAGAQVALGNLADRSPSISLANTAMMLQSFDRAGGAQYAEAVSEAAVNIQRMIEVRNTAQARAAQAMQAAAIVPLILAFVLITMSADPAISSSFKEPLVQIIIVFVMLVMGFGYLFMRNQVRRVV